MPNHTSVQRKRIAGITRMPRSQYGNPAYSVTFTDGSNHATASNAMVAYEITNSTYRDVDVMVTLERKRTYSYIIGIRVAKDGE